MRNLRTQTKTKVFFNSSFRADDGTKIASLNIYKLINQMGFFHCYDFKRDEEEYLQESPENKLNILYSTALKSLHQCDIVILEVSTNSFTQGYILEKALEMGKPVVAFHQKNKYSIFIKGIKNSLLQTVEYDDYNLKEQLEDALSFAVDNLLTKFNFYLSNDISNYLNWMSKKRKLPKSEFVRELIRLHMNINQEYLSTFS